MPKHIVKCLYCSQLFDANLEEFVQIKRRYAHKACAKAHEEQKSKEEKDKIALEEYIKDLLGLEVLNQKIKRQIKDYIDEYNYTYSGIHKALKYFYEVKEGDIYKANGGIGIVGYIYNDAFNYYYAQWLANEKNRDKNIQEYVPKVIEVKIKPPIRKTKKRKLFDFLDEEE